MIDGIVLTSSNQLSYSTSHGNRYDANNHTFTGYFDNFFIWNKSLSVEEINEFSTCPPAQFDSELIGYWNFEEGNGSTVNDQTSNGNNGIINGATFSTDVPDQSCELTTVNGCDSVSFESYY